MNILLSIAQLPRATFYYHLKKAEQPDKYKEAKEVIAAIYHENKGRYGYRRVTTELYNRNMPMNHKTVQRLMRELGLVSRVRIKKSRSYKGEVGKIAPNLPNRDFKAKKPNEKWATDVTEFNLFGEKLYLSPILDLYSSDLVRYTISDRPVLSMVTTMLLFLDTNKVFDAVSAVLKNIQQELAIPYNERLAVRFIFHKSFMIERSIKGEVLQYKKLTNFISLHKSLFETVRHHFQLIQNSFVFRIPDAELAYITEIIMDYLPSTSDIDTHTAASEDKGTI